MAFHFTLDAVLRYRQSLEESEWLGLQNLMAKRVSLEKELQVANDAFQAAQVSLRRSLEQEPVTGAEIHLATAWLRILAERQARLHSGLRDVQSAIAGQRKIYQQRRQQREVLDALREAQQREYRLQQRRREQAVLDDLHLLRRGHELA